MANQEQLDILKEGAYAWNKWREKNPSVEINLSGADLGGVHLRNAELRNADLSAAYLVGADLSGAHLIGATWSVSTCTWPGSGIQFLGLLI